MEKHKHTHNLRNEHQQNYCERHATPLCIDSWDGPSPESCCPETHLCGKQKTDEWKKMLLMQFLLTIMLFMLNCWNASVSQHKQSQVPSLKHTYPVRGSPCWKAGSSPLPHLFQLRQGIHPKISVETMT